MIEGNDKFATTHINKLNASRFPQNRVGSEPEIDQQLINLIGNSQLRTPDATFQAPSTTMLLPGPRPTMMNCV